MVLGKMDKFKVTACVVLCLALTDGLSASNCPEMNEFRKEFDKFRTETSTKLLMADSKIQELEVAAANTDAEMDTLKRENEQLRKLHTSKRFVVSNPFAEKPAFSASLSNHSMNLGNNQPIVFDKMFTNDLGAYSPISGVFTVPMNGTYFFTATVMSHTNQYLETDICLNGNTLVKMYSYDTSHEQGTNSVVLALKAGDLVWVRHHGTNGHNAYGSGWSSFSGFMI